MTNERNHVVRAALAGGYVVTALTFVVWFFINPMTTRDGQSTLLIFFTAPSGAMLGALPTAIRLFALSGRR